MATALKDISSGISDSALFRQQCYIDGAWVDADSGETIAVTDPATGEHLGTVPKLGADETRRAIDAAERALPEWRAKTAKERSAILRRWFDLMMEHQEELGYLMTREQGKPLPEAKGEIAYGASFIEWFAEEGKRVYGDVIPQTIGSRRGSRHQAARRCLCRDYALELPQCDDHTQMRPRIGRWLHFRCQTRDHDPLLCPRLCRTGRARWACPRVCLMLLPAAHRQ